MSALEKAACDSGALFLGAVASPLESELPAGVLEQLFRGPGLPPDVAERATRLLNADQGSLRGWFRGIWRVLRGVTEQCPVVISIDDVHHADESSLHCLLYLERRLRTAPLLTVLTMRPGSRTATLPLCAEFLLEPHSRRIELRPLSPDGVADLLAERMDEAVARRLAPAFHDAGAGNPALTEALADDYAAAAEPVDPEHVAGQAFGRAVVGFLRRHDFPVMDVARVVAVMNRPVPPRLLCGLLDIDAESAARSVAVLTSSRIVDDAGFRHAAAREAVADGVPFEERGHLHLRMAELLHAEGAAAPDVAEHILASNECRAPWALPTLREAARQALARDDLDTGIRYLRAAHEMCHDERQRAVIASMLADAEWRIDPTTVQRRLPEFDLAIRENLLDGRYAAAPLITLLWQGRVAEALRTVEVITRNGAGEPGGETPADLELVPLRLWPTYHYPELQLSGCFGDAQPEGADHDAGFLLMARLRERDIEGALVAAERILERTRLTEQTLVSLTIALGTVVYGGPLTQAARWCDALLDEAAARHSPTWRALFSARRSLIHLWQGELQGAEERAHAALNLIPREGWGVTVGLPLSCLIMVKTLTGRQEEAAALLDVDVPKATFRTAAGQHYLYARGRHHLAAGRFHAALCDFRACGSVWEFVSSVEPWRLGAAEALLGLGDRSEAERLADEQVAVALPTHARTRGIALRVKAAARDVTDRAVLLEESAELLEGYGDRLELSCTLRDLSAVRVRLGAREHAADLAHRAAVLARECGVPERPDAGAAGRDSGDPVLRLSDAERRVASLAAEGYSNREISRKLCITTSTVEQHLTKIYRKLDVSRVGLKTVLRRGDG